LGAAPTKDIYPVLALKIGNLGLGDLRIPKRFVQNSNRTPFLLRQSGLLAGLSAAVEEKI
jgi:hypothetical protein